MNQRCDVPAVGKPEHNVSHGGFSRLELPANCKRPSEYQDGPTIDSDGQTGILSTPMVNQSLIPVALTRESFSTDVSPGTLR